MESCWAAPEAGGMIDSIEQSFRLVASLAALAVEAAAVLAITAGAAEAILNVVRRARWGSEHSLAARVIWIRFASWILLALEFTLGADIIRSAIAPSWDEIGKLGAIAAIRTALNFFLDRDISRAEEPQDQPVARETGGG